MQWTEDFESGLPELDRQHRVLYQLVQQLEGFEGTASRTDVERLLGDIERAARGHFAWEERLGLVAAYPELSRHAADHASLLVEFQRHRQSDVFSPKQLARVLSNWLMSHTLMEDRPFAAYLKSHSALRAASGEAIATEAPGVPREDGERA